MLAEQFLRRFNVVSRTQPKNAQAGTILLTSCNRPVTTSRYQDAAA